MMVAACSGMIYHDLTVLLQLMINTHYKQIIHTNSSHLSSQTPRVSPFRKYSCLPSQRNSTPLYVRDSTTKDFISS